MSYTKERELAFNFAYHVTCDGDGCEEKEVIRHCSSIIFARSRLESKGWSTPREYGVWYEYCPQCTEKRN